MASAIYLALLAALAAGGQTALPFVPASTPFDNALARVELSATAPGVPTKPHEHATSRVLIYFNAGRNDITFQNGEVRHEVFDVGTVLWNNAMGTHVAEISGAAPVNLVHVELKSPPDMKPTAKYTADDPLKLAPGQYKLEIDNNQVRVLRLHLAPGERTPLTDDPFERLFAPVTAGRLKVTDSGGGTKAVVYRQAGLQWLMPGKEADQNIGDRPYEAVIVEFKK